MERLAEEDEEDGVRHRLHRIQVILRTDYSPQTIILKGTVSVTLNDLPCQGGNARFMMVPLIPQVYFFSKVATWCFYTSRFRCFGFFTIKLSFLHQVVGNPARKFL